MHLVTVNLCATI